MTPLPNGGETGVLVVGDVMTDIVVRPAGPIARGSDTPAEISIHPGGSAANLAGHLARAGIPVRFAARVGAADLDRLRRYFEGLGIEARLAADPVRQTGRLIALVDTDGERSFLTDRGANDGLCEADLPAGLLDGIRHVHLSGYAFTEPGPRAAAASLLETAQKCGLTTSVDPGSLAVINTVGADEFLRLTGGVTLLCPNSDELDALSYFSNGKRNTTKLFDCYPIVVVKQSGEGASLFRVGNDPVYRPAPAVSGVLDATGAGDAFLAAFLSAWLGGAAPEAALERAVAAGSAMVATVGAAPASADGTALMAHEI